MQPRNQATLIGGGAIALWATLALLTAASGAAPPFEMAGLTFLVGGAVGLAYAAARGRLALLWQPWPVWAVGVGGLFGYHALYFAALRAAPPAQASLVAYLWPLLIVLFSALLPGEKLHWRHVAGAALGFGGAALLIGAGGADAPPGWGLLLALGCAFVWTGYSLASRLLREAPTEAVAGFCLATSALAWVCHFAFEANVWPTRASEIAAIFALGVGPVGLAFYLWDFGVKHGDIRLLGVGAYAAPALSTILLVVTGYAPATATLGLACAAIVGGAVIASL
jgi:drug/metabolite transporter (DMT)-like permease